MQITDTYKTHRIWHDFDTSIWKNVSVGCNESRFWLQPKTITYVRWNLHMTHSKKAMAIAIIMQDIFYESRPEKSKKSIIPIQSANLSKSNFMPITNEYDDYCTPSTCWCTVHKKQAVVFIQQPWLVCESWISSSATHWLSLTKGKCEHYEQPSKGKGEVSQKMTDVPVSSGFC